MEVTTRIIDYYYTPNQKCPYKIWFSSLGKTQQLMVDIRLNRVRLAACACSQTSPTQGCCLRRIYNLRSTALSHFNLFIRGERYSCL